jgi:hypothetical protein
MQTKKTHQTIPLILGVLLLFMLALVRQSGTDAPARAANCETKCGMARRLKGFGCRLSKR